MALKEGLATLLLDEVDQIILVIHYQNVTSNKTCMNAPLILPNAYHHPLHLWHKL